MSCIYWPTNETEASELWRARVSNTRLVADTHRKWFTHKNPYGCWICDLFEILDHSVYRKNQDDLNSSRSTDSHDSSGIDQSNS